MSKAIYYPEDGRQVEFDILKKNEDGTVDLAFEGQSVVTSCAITELPTVGACVIAEDEKPTKSKDK